MGFLDYMIIGIVGIAFLAALRFLKKNGTGCGNCKGDCASCHKKEK